MPNIGIITEQGDLGLGFDNLNDKDQQIYNEALKNQAGTNQQVINEGNKDKQ